MLQFSGTTEEKTGNNNIIPLTFGTSGVTNAFKVYFHTPNHPFSSSKCVSITK